MAFTDEINALVLDMEAKRGQTLQLLAGLSEGVLAGRPAEKEWSIKEVLAHLAHIQRDYILPMAIKMRDEANPEIHTISEEVRLARAAEGGSARIATIMAEMHRGRAHILDFAASLEQSQLERTGKHPTRGQVNIRWALERMAAHEETHIEQIKNNIALLQPQKR